MTFFTQAKVTKFILNNTVHGIIVYRLNCFKLARSHNALSQLVESIETQMYTIKRWKGRIVFFFFTYFRILHIFR